MDEKKQLIKDNLSYIFERLPSGVTLLAASKTVAPEYINFAADCGLKLIGENRVNELLEKYEYIDKDRLDIHFIGQLQTNKVKYIVDKVSMIHSVDSLKLAEEISKRSLKIGKVMDVLVEINIGAEASKGGIMPNETEQFLREISRLEGIKVKGLMTIPPKSEDKEKNLEFFEKIRKIFIDISVQNVDNINMEYLSAGMSSDWQDAIRCGANMVRIGSGIFGKRDYPTQV